MQEMSVQPECESVGIMGPDASTGISIAILINNKPDKEFDEECYKVLDKLKIMYDKADIYLRFSADKICQSISQLESLRPIRILHVIVVGYSRENAPVDNENCAIGLREALTPFTSNTHVLLTLFGCPRPRQLRESDAVDLGGPNTVSQFHQPEYSGHIKNSQTLCRHLSQHFLHRLHEYIHAFCVTIPAWLYTDNSESALLVFVASLEKSQREGVLTPDALQEAASRLADEYRLYEGLEPIVKNGHVPCWL